MSIELPVSAVEAQLAEVANWGELRALFKEAEEALHEAETIHGDLSIPSVNQLRYAGHHIVSLAGCTDRAEAEEAYQRARRHCQRAIYDAFDSAVCYLLKGIAQFREDYRKVEITPHFPAYAEVMRKARQARDILVTARNTQNTREEYYVECRAVARDLRQQYDLMIDAREELNKALRNHNRNIILGWFASAGTLAAIVAAIAAILALKS